MQHSDLPRIGPTSFLLGIALAALVALCALHVVKHLDRRRRVRRAARAFDAERAAARVLSRAGYAIVGRQVRRAWSVFVDGQELSFELIADYLVEDGKTAWVAEVKTGERALNLQHGPTRRQLLEYRLAFGVPGVLLVDAEADQVRRVVFREPAREERPRTALWWLGAGCVLGFLLRHYGAAAVVLPR